MKNATGRFPMTTQTGDSFAQVRTALGHAEIDAIARRRNRPQPPTHESLAEAMARQRDRENLTR